MSKLYFNRTKKLFSVREKVNGKEKVTDHKYFATIVNPSSIVQEGGRKRTIREGKNYVHAFITGDITNTIDANGLVEIGLVKYNPIDDDQFIVEIGNGVVMLNAYIERMIFERRKPVIHMYVRNQLPVVELCEIK